MSYYPQASMTAYKRAVKSAINIQLKKWYTDLHKPLTLLISDIENVISSFIKLPSENDITLANLRHVAEMHRRLLEGCKSTAFITDITAESLFNPLLDRFAALHKQIPGKYTRIVENDFYAPKQADSSVTKLWKTAHRFRLLTEKALFAIFNRAAQMMKKPPRSPAPEKRQTMPRALFQNVIDPALLGFFRDEWLSCVESAGVKFSTIHTDFEKLTATWLEPAIWQKLLQRDTTAVEDLMKSAKIALQSMPKLAQQRAAFLKELALRFEDTWAVIEQNFATAWLQSGTLLTSAKKNRQRQFLRRRQRLLREEAASLKKWRIYFDSESADWQKDIELCIFQVQTLCSWMETVQRIDEKIKASIIPLVQVMQIGQRHYRNFQRLARLTPREATIEDSLSRYLAATRKKINSLPYVYQRLFRMEPLQDDRFYYPRDEVIEQMKDDLHEWQQERHSATALIGEKGSGKTTTLLFAEKALFVDFPVIRLDLEVTVITEKELFGQLSNVFADSPVANIDELEKWINDRLERSIFIFENLHKLFLRRVDGFDALQRFLLFISRTSSRLHWIVTSSLYGWHYLDKVVGLQASFQRVIAMDKLSEDSIRDVILKRHQVRGYDLIYTIPESLKRSRKFRRLHEDDHQLMAQDYFFKKLNALASSNITVAMLFWQRAIDKIDDNRILIDATLAMDYSFLYHLPDADLFIMAMLIQHEILTETELASVLRLDVRVCEMQLLHLVHEGIAVRKTGGYVLHYFLYRPIVETLKARNIIH